MPASASINRWKRLTGTSRPTATTNGVGDFFSFPGEKRGSIPGGTTVTSEGRKCSLSTISSFEDCDKVTIGVRRYNGGATRNSTVRPNFASRGGNVISHIESCT